jgi:glycosyltransferase involved in cell wall biosynthesis
VTKITMTLGIVIPSYNQGKFLYSAITSCLDPDNSVKIVVMDGGSTDESVDVIRDLESRIHYWKSEKDRGQAAAINSGIMQLKTEYVTWLNSDDCFVSGSLNIISKYLNNYKPDVVFGNHLAIDEQGRVTGRHYHPPWSRYLSARIGPYICQPGTFVRRSVWLEHNGLNESLHCVMDTDLWIRINKKFGVFSHINSYLAKFRIHGESKGATWKAQYAKEYEFLKKQYGLSSPPARYNLGLYYGYKMAMRLCRK